MVLNACLTLSPKSPCLLVFIVLPAASFCGDGNIDGNLRGRRRLSHHFFVDVRYGNATNSGANRRLDTASDPSPGTRILADAEVSYGPNSRRDSCYVCGNLNDYQCSSNSFGGWNNGIRTFDDPTGGEVCGLTATVFGECAFPDGINVFLNGALLGEVSDPSTSCVCGGCTTATTGPISQGSFSYNGAGATNTVQLVYLGSGSTCIDRVEFDLVLCPPADTTPPVITVPPNANIQCGDEDTGFATASDDGGCVAPPTVTSSDVSSGGTCPEDITRTWTAIDCEGNESSAIQTITIADTTNPSITAPAEATVECSADASSSSTGSATGIDNCDDDVDVSESDSVAAGSCPQESTITRTWKATDDCGNFAEADQVINVVDTTAPVMTLPPDTTIEFCSDSSSTTTGMATASDNCDADVNVAEGDSFTTGACPNESTIIRTRTATDDCGNESSEVQTISVIDTTPPTASCKVPFDLYLDASGITTIVADNVDNGSTDSCDGDTTLSLSQTNFGCSHVGDNNVALTVTDACGNAATCNTIVKVFDVISPAAICKDVTVQLDSFGDVGIVAADINSGSSDICGIASLVASQTSFACADVGANIVTLTVNDNSSNPATCTSTVAVEDNVAPIAVCKDVTVKLDGAGKADITISDIDHGSNDACGISTLSLDNSSFDCSDVGPNTVILTVTDVNGNTATCPSTVTVEDNIDPVAVCNDFTLVLANGGGTISPESIGGGSYDNCGSTRTLSKTSFDCKKLGDEIVTLTVTDDSGNEATCTSTITVQDEDLDGDGIGNLCDDCNKCTDEDGNEGCTLCSQTEVKVGKNKGASSETKYKLKCKGGISSHMKENIFQPKILCDSETRNPKAHCFNHGDPCAVTLPERCSSDERCSNTFP